MYRGHFNGHISSFLTRRHNPRGHFEDTKDEKIDLWEDVVGVEEFDEICKEDSIDIKENLIIADDIRDMEYCCEQCDYTSTII